MIKISTELRKELAYAIVDDWSKDKVGQDKILQIFHRTKGDVRTTVVLLTDDMYNSVKDCVDKTFLKLLNVLLTDLEIALDDWIDVFKICRWDDYLKYGAAYGT
jgi:hypothetical protein